MVTKLLQTLLDSDVLTEDTKTSITSAFTTVVQEAKEQARAEVTEELTAKFAEEFVKERDALIESLDTVVSAAVEAHATQSGKALTEHINSHIADIEAFRDLEAENAANLVEARANLVESTKTDIKNLVEKLDSFLDLAVAAEFSEIREDLVESQRTALGARIFEGFRNEFEQYYAQSTGITGQVEKLTARVKATARENDQLKESLQTITRTQSMTEVLSPLEGKARQVMETILATVATDKLHETYERFVDRVISEGVDSSTKGNRTRSEKESKQVLAESRVNPRTVNLRTGDTNMKKPVITENVGLSESDKRRLLQSAGLA